MEAFYIATFIAFAIPAAVLEFAEKGWTNTRNEPQPPNKTEYIRFRNNYVLVFSLMMGEWPSCVHSSQPPLYESNPDMHSTG